MTERSAEDGMDILKRWNGAIRAKDLVALRDMMADDIVIELPFNESGRTDHGSFRVYRGAEECVAFWREAFAEEGQVHRSSEVEVSIANGGARIFVEFRGHLTMRSGREYRNRYVIRYDLADGRIARCKEYYNPIQSAFAFGRPVAGHHHIESL